MLKKSGNRSGILTFLLPGSRPMETVRPSGKGQFILPKAIRDRRHWKAGTEFVIFDRGYDRLI